MTTCRADETGIVELYFYGELEPAEASRFERHLDTCARCAEALGDLKVIRATLAARPDVAAPPSGEWSGFMQRLDAAISSPAAGVVPFRRPEPVRSRPFVGVLATAALLALVTLSVFVASRAGRSAGQPVRHEVTEAAAAKTDVPVQAGLTSVGLKHLERSKLVVLGLAAKETTEAVDDEDWSYERELASALLNDTRLYRLAAEERGLTSLAGVMKDLELVLLQTAMAETTDRSALPQIQRLIQKRGLVQKMDVVATTGMLP